MAEKLTDLTALSARPATNDVTYIVDVSDTTDATSGTSKQITMSNLLDGLPKIVTGYSGYVVVPGPSSTNRYLVQSGDILMGKGSFAGGNMIMAVATQLTPTLDAHLDFYVNNAVIT